MDGGLLNKVRAATVWGHFIEETCPWLPWEATPIPRVKHLFPFKTLPYRNIPIAIFEGAVVVKYVKGAKELTN